MVRKTAANLVFWGGFMILGLFVIQLFSHGMPTATKAKRGYATVDELADDVLPQFYAKEESVRKTSAKWQYDQKSHNFLKMLMDGKYADLQAVMEKEYPLTLEFNAANAALFHVADWVSEYKTPMKEIIPRLDAWVQAYPSSTITHAARGIAYYEYGWAERGGAWASETSQKQMNNFEALLEVSQDDISKAIELDPKNGIAWSRLVSLAFLRGGRAAGETAFAAAALNVPDYFWIYERYLNFTQDKWFGGDGESVALARKLAQHAPDDSIVHYALLEAHASEAQWMEQRSERPDSSLVGSIANWFGGSKKITKKEYYADPAVWKDISESIQKITKYHPLLTDAFLTYAEILSDVGYAEESLAYYKHAAAIDPSSGTRAMALVLYNQGRYAEATPLFETHVALHPDDGPGHRMLAYTYQDAKRYKEAMAHYIAAARIDPKDAYSWGRACGCFGWVFPKSGYQDGVALCDRSIALDPSDGYAHEAKAWLLHEMGKNQEAAAERQISQQLKQKAQ